MRNRLKEEGLYRTATVLCLSLLLMAGSALAETASQIELVDGTTYDNVTYTVDRDNRRLVIDDGDWTRHISFNDVIRIIGADGSDRTASVLGRRPTTEQETTNRPESQPVTRKRPFRFAAVFTANASFPSLSGYYEGFESGLGASTDLILPLSRRFAVRFLLSRSGAHVGDVFVTDHNVNERINLSDYVSSEVWYYGFAIQYYSWPNWERGGKRMYSLYVGVGPLETIMKPPAGDQRFSDDKETIGALTLGAGFDWLLTGRLSFASIAQATMVIGNYEYRPMEYFFGRSDGGTMVDIKLGLSVIM